MNYRIPFYSLLLLLICGAAPDFSNGHGSKRKPECVALNDTGMSFYFKYFRTLDTAYIDSALRQFNMAIACDTTYFIAYSNKMNMLMMLQDTTAALQCADKLASLSRKEPMTMIMRASTYDAYGNHDLARESFHEIYDTTRSILLKTDTFQTNIAQAYVIASAHIYGEVIATKKCDSLIELYKNNPKAVSRLNDIRPWLEQMENSNYTPGRTGIEVTIPLNDH